MFKKNPIASDIYITALVVAATSSTCQWPMFGMPLIANASQIAPLGFVNNDSHQFS